MLEGSPHRRRTNTEEKAKVVAAVWGKEFIQFLAALSILHQDDLKKRMADTKLNGGIITKWRILNKMADSKQDGGH